MRTGANRSDSIRCMCCHVSLEVSQNCTGSSVIYAAGLTVGAFVPKELTLLRVSID